MKKYLEILRKNNNEILSLVYKEIHKSGFFKEAIKINSLSDTSLNVLLENTNKNLVSIGKDNITVSIDSSILNISIKTNEVKINVYCTTSNVYTAQQIQNFDLFINECSFIITKKIKSIDDYGRNKEIKIVYLHSDIKNEITVFYNLKEFLKQLNCLLFIVMGNSNPKHIFNVEKLENIEKIVEFSLFEKISKITSIEDYLEPIMDYLFLNIEIEQNKKDMLFLSEDISETLIHSCDEYLLNLNNCHEK